MTQIIKQHIENSAFFIGPLRSPVIFDRYKIVNRQNLESAADRMVEYLRKQEEMYRNKT
jgi:hypothetical protein